MAGIVDEKRGTITKIATLREAIAAIESAKKTIAIVVNTHNQVVGTVTDGDVRRAILAGMTLDRSVADAMNIHPITAHEGATDTVLVQLLQQHNLEAIPIVDETGHLCRIAHIDELIPGDAPGGGEGFYAAVIMAGGQGHRLRPLTDNVPKPMVDIGGVPLIERQIWRLARAGVRRIFVSINYLGSLIEEHLGDGSAYGTSITYLREKAKLGTAGALALLPEAPTGPILVLNGDILTTSAFRNFLSFHDNHQAAITIGAITHRVQIPYGVIRYDGVNATALVEKPTQAFFCNAGIYVVSPEILRYVPELALYNMTDLIHRCMAEGNSVVVFPIHEYWSDIGTLHDLEKARACIDVLDSTT